MLLAGKLQVARVQRVGIRWKGWMRSSKGKLVGLVGECNLYDQRMEWTGKRRRRKGFIKLGSQLVMKAYGVFNTPIFPSSQPACA